jgi:signal transduction histidine kinase
VDALNSRGDITTNVHELVAARVAVAPLRHGRWFGRAWLAAGFAAVAILASAWFSFVELPLALTIADSAQGQVVHSVGVGSLLWRDNVRPQDPVIVIAETDRYVVSTPNNGKAGGDMHRRGDFEQDLALGTVVVLASVLLGLGKLPGAAAAAGAGVAIVVAPALPELGFPAALPLVLLSAGTALAAVRIPDQRLKRTFDALGLGAVVLIVVTAFLLMRDLGPISWDLVWAAPLGMAIGLGVLGETLGVRARLSGTPVAGQSRRSRVLGAIVPLAASSRLEGADEERSRLAIELHNRVLPQFRSSARAIRKDGSPDEAAERLEDLEAELREVMRRNETVTLEIGGLSEALRVHMDAVDTAGIRIVFEVHAAGERRPPAKVELAAYRIGQAAIDNAIRHAGAERVDVSVTTGPDLVEVIVRDDGVGIESAAEVHARRRGRIGLAQMRLRADAAGGSLKVDGRAGKGTEIRFFWAG